MTRWKMCDSLTYAQNCRCRQMLPASLHIHTVYVLVTVGLWGGYSEREVALKPTSRNMAKRSAQYHMKAIGSRVLTAQLAADPPLLLGCKGGDAPRPFCRQVEFSVLRWIGTVRKRRKNEDA